MQAIRPIIRSEFVGLAIQIVQLCVLNAVSRAADRLAKVRRVVCLVKGCLGKAKNDVMTCDVEFLDDCTLGEKGKR